VNDAGGSAAPLRIIITGAAGGIGMALVRRCATAGAHMVLVDSREDVVAVAAGLGDQVHAEVADVTDRRAAAAICDRAAERMGGVDGLVNLAGIHFDGSVTDLSDHDWDHVLAVNLTAPFAWCRAAIPHLVRAGGGSIVNVGSIASLRALPTSAAYVASKTGLLGLSRSIAIDYARQGIRCNSVCPGSIETPFFRDYVRRNPEAGARLLERSQVGRFGTAEEVAACCEYLLSPVSAFVNGVEIPIDGGRSTAG
jgi:NAD(P)-dependent dehydrogenase (short-subunit alcohol dehydrogenase family)